MSPNLDVLIPLFVKNGVADGHEILKRIQEQHPSVTEKDMVRAIERLQAMGKISLVESSTAELPTRIDLRDVE